MFGNPVRPLTVVKVLSEDLTVLLASKYSKNYAHHMNLTYHFEEVLKILLCID